MSDQSAKYTWDNSSLERHYARLGGVEAEAIDSPESQIAMNKASFLHRRVKAYFSSPWVMAKDFILFCLAVPGLASLLSPSMVCDLPGTILPVEPHGPLPYIQSKAPPGSCNCGSSVAEAKELGCQYDALASAWLPRQCIDEDLTAEFERSGDGPAGKWQYWLDKNRTQEITVQQLSEMADDPDFRWHSTTEWHVTHCFFYWRKQHRARSNGVLVEPRYDNEQHINHCGGIIRSGKDVGVISDVVFVSDWP